MFLAALSAVTIHLGTLVSKYRQWPTQEMTSLEHIPVSFPDVTVCSLRRVSISNVAKLIQNPSSNAFKYQNTLNKWNAAIDNEWLNRRSRAAISFYENIGSHEASLIGNSKTDFIISCMSRSAHCTEEQIISNVNPYFYHCYTFKGESASNNIVVAGPGYGLAMVFYLETYNGTMDGHSLKTFSSIGNTVGVRVTIHAPGTIPLPYTHGFDIMPGHSTSIALNVQHIKRMADPYGKCTRNESLRDLEAYRYSLSACQELCMQRNCQSECGCQSSYHPLPQDSEHEVYCGSLNQPPEDYIKSTLCEFGAWVAFNNDSLRREACNCPVQCDQFTYNPVITESYWPDPSTYLNFFDGLIAIRPDRASLKSYQQLNKVLHDPSVREEDRLQIVRLNFARLSVYFRDLEILKREEVC